jgi:pimeloyl-ACP methyl ester carboxylesterase
MPSSPDVTLPPASRPVRKDEIELHERGLYIESWLPERRSRRKPLLFIHGELGGSWAWERFLGYFAGRGWEGHALNLRNHHWSQTADPAELSFESFVEDVGAAYDRLRPSVVAVGHGMGGLLALKAAERRAVSGLVLIAPELPGDVREPTEAHRIREVPACTHCEGKFRAGKDELTPESPAEAAFSEPAIAPLAFGHSQLREAS